MNRSIITLTLAAGLALTAATASATPIRDRFSFTNTTGFSQGTVKGTVTLKSEGSNVIATSIILESYPAGLDTSPLDTNLLTLGTPNNNSFTVNAAGVISAARFALSSALNSLQFNGSGGLNSLAGSTGFVSDYGFAALNFTPIVSAAVPEPVTLGLLAVGLTGLGVARVRAARKNTKA